MKTKTILLLTSFLCLIVGIGGCEKDEILPPNQAKGRVLGATEPCYGNGVYIEVENPKGIGEKGTFSRAGWEYENAICVPYFDRINLPPEFMKEGTWLHFEYRELTEEEKNQGLFIPDEFIICQALWGPPKAKVYIITKIISHGP
jgi:hypothetical protein